ncbi:MAG: asparagine synthetase B [Acidobacteria bacterium]|nr:MAG: asparagine synthetase B [Acidobacteriota bacterium]
MSGIAGILNLDGAPVDRRLLQRMTEFMAFRGPDALEIWSDGAVGLGHAMLRTSCEAERERLPTSLDGQAWITADARLDGRAELIEKLQTCGRSGLDSASDAELLLHSYHAWGDACVEHLLGDFAFILWDAARRRLFCARDHLGAKPFYYARVGASLILSNTLDCVRVHPEVPDRLNELAIADFLLFTYNQDPATTTFADVLRLPPAHSLTCADGTLRSNRYWTLPVEDVIRYRQRSEYVEHFLQLLRVGVADRLRTNRVSVQMSGGLDSTSVAAMAKQVLASRGEPFDLRAFTVDYRGLLKDEEVHYARIVAQKLGISMHLLPGTNGAPYKGWDQPELHTPEPSHEPLLVLQYEQFWQMAENSRLALSGDGGDVVLFGQSWPYLSGLWKQRQFLRLAAEVGAYIASHGRLPPLLGGFRTRVKRWLGQPENLPEYPAWLDRGLEERLDLRARWEELNRTPAPVHPFRPRAYQVLASGFWTSVFESQDPGVTRVPVEVQRPYFDLRLVRFLLRLPPVPWCADKELLRVAMQGVLPEQVRCRPKSPLAGEPVVELWRRKPCHAETLLAGTPELTCYVDPRRLSPVQPERDPESVWLALRPISLSLWLRTTRNLQYKKYPEEGNEGIQSVDPEKTLSHAATGRVRKSC